VRDVNAGYGAVRVLHGVSIEVREGETVALLGTNGNGKSTLIKCIMAMVTPEAGEIVLETDGARIDLTRKSTEEIVGLGIALVPEGRRLFPKLSVEENLLLGAYRPEARADIAANLDFSFEAFPVLAERRRQLAAVPVALLEHQEHFVTKRASLVRQWTSDENYSHGLLVVPFALLFAWRSRRGLAIAPRPHPLGLVVVAASMAVFLAGQFAAELFLMRVSLIGAAGRMGKTVLDLAAADPKIDIVAQCDLGDRIAPAMKNCDVIVDFSHCDSIDEICRAATQHGKSLVIGTTGHSKQQRRTIEKAAESLPIVFASNFSIGVNVLFWLTRKAAELVGRDFNPEIIETHHKMKKDAPSGTAKTLAEILRATRNSEIPIQSIREGDVVGEHTVIFGEPGESLELTHRAANRGIFAGGALRAAKWTINKPPGLYSMQDVLGL